MSVLCCAVTAIDLINDNWIDRLSRREWAAVSCQIEISALSSDFSRNVFYYWWWEVRIHVRFRDKATVCIASQRRKMHSWVQGNGLHFLPCPGHRCGRMVNNSPIHNVSSVKQLLGWKKITVSEHPPHWTFFLPYDLFLLHKIKIELKLTYFQQRKTEIHKHWWFDQWKERPSMYVDF